VTSKNVIRIAAVADIHISEGQRGSLRPHVQALKGHADALLLAGDLTYVGRLEEAEVLAGELQDAPVPVIAVLGNHDHHRGLAGAIREALGRVGVTTLEGESITLDVRGQTLGIAGVKGFCGGFKGSQGHKFGEPEMKTFIQATDDAAFALETQLRALQADRRVALMHYAPVRDTVQGERPEIFSYLGAYQLEEAIDRAGADLALHGHAHYGSAEGATSGGIPVRNVALNVIRRPYAIYTLP
jgi:Icc-related predicted phosphoesterase